MKAILERMSVGPTKTRLPRGESDDDGAPSSKANGGHGISYAISTRQRSLPHAYFFSHHHFHLHGLGRSIKKIETDTGYPVLILTIIRIRGIRHFTICIHIRTTEYLFFWIGSDNKYRIIITGLPYDTHTTLHLKVTRIY